MKFKRILAYILDMLIVYVIASVIFMACFNNTYQKFNKASEEYLSSLRSTISETENKEIDEKVLEETKNINYKYLKAGTTQTIIILTVEIIYFIFVQYFNNGQTLGKKLFKIRIKQMKEERLNAGLFVLRESVLFLFPIQIINLICLLTTKMNTYLTINSFTTNIQSLVTLIIIALILFRSDGRGLHEMMSKTEIILEKREK